MITHINACEAYSLLQNNTPPIVLDLRTSDEFGMFHIKGAINIDCKSEFFERKIKKLPRSQSYLIHCHSGSRSLESLEAFRPNGFNNIYHLDGGLRAWIEADLPLISNWSI